ncbi:MAG: hypothetical protein ABI700_00415 [Chloroflexota bacterium]
MIQLSTRNTRELAQLDTAITHLDSALAGLLARGIVDGHGGVVGRGSR